jgi:hypothetical protein
MQCRCFITSKNSIAFPSIPSPDGYAQDRISGRMTASIFARALRLHRQFPASTLAVSSAITEFLLCSLRREMWEREFEEFDDRDVLHRNLEDPITAWLRIPINQAVRQIVAAVSKHRNMESRSE